jgi:hypothetical protein
MRLPTSSDLFHLWNKWLRSLNQFVPLLWYEIILLGITFCLFWWRFPEFDRQFAISCIAITHILYKWEVLQTTAKRFFRSLFLYLQYRFGWAGNQTGHLWDFLLMLMLLGVCSIFYFRWFSLLFALFHWTILHFYGIVLVIALLQNLLILLFHHLANKLRDAHHGRPKARDTIYLFSSNFRSYYGKNVLTVTSLPHGAIDHFRYRMKWVSDDFTRNDTTLRREIDLKQFEGTQVLIIAADTPGLDNIDAHEPDSLKDHFTFYPLRQGTVTRLEVDGPVLHVYIQLGDYVDWNTGLDPLDDDEARKEKIKRYDNAIKAELTSHSTTKLYPHRRLKLNPAVGDPLDTFGKYCVFKEKSALQEITYRHYEDSAQAWHDLLGVLVDVRRTDTETHENTIFVRLNTIFAVRPLFWLQKQIRHLKSLLFGQHLPTYDFSPIEAVEIAPTESGYELVSASDYLMELSFYYPRYTVPPRFDHYTVVPIADKAMFSFLPDQIDVNYRYDQFFVPLTAPAVTTDTLTRFKLGLSKREGVNQPTEVEQLHYLELEAKRGAGTVPTYRIALKEKSGNPPHSEKNESSGIVVVPDLEFVFKIVYPRYRYLFAFVVLFLGQVITAFEGFEAQLPNWATSLTGVISVLAAYGGIIGPAITTLTLFFIFRNLPAGAK